jgi:hypothetical protein
MNEAKQNRDAEHNDLDNLAIYDPDICTEIDCYFEAETGNLWHAYLGDHDIFEIIRDTTIQFLENKYRDHCDKVREQDSIDRAADRYESRQLDAVMNRHQWQPMLDSLTVRA